MKVLVTGGLGYIGSHTVVELQNEGFEVVIIDNLSNASIEVLDGITAITGKKPGFEYVDLREKPSLQQCLAKHHDIVGTIHFAASKAVGESVNNPLHYYENNLCTLVYLLQELTQKAHASFIFSSSCTVYGQAHTFPITEAAPIQPAASPYGHTKQVGETILRDTCKANPNLAGIALRYFNPIGAHPSAEIGELPTGVPQNLVPFITQTAIGLRQGLSVFGNDYPTPDGTCIRDYIHVVDLAKAHVVALQWLLDGKHQKNYDVFNLGTGKGHSVLEVIQHFERISGKTVPYTVGDRRPGDVTQAYADTQKAANLLGWKPQFTLSDALKSAWTWETKISN